MSRFVQKKVVVVTFLCLLLPSFVLDFGGNCFLPSFHPSIPLLLHAASAALGQIWSQVSVCLVISDFSKSSCVLQCKEEHDLKIEEERRRSEFYIVSLGFSRVCLIEQLKEVV